ncbi:uncharacterized protein A1O9_13072 [Exophiala aquamarina CBS 119918]|uniref:Zinc finger PHD-type domain-containing protein n=1 Tax=Exophiala aquamarina CBS 119918 TaxID=1182545 RepID=A0A072NTC7_9EURO|nr:uncharacterized protein A1O9_13072 [Exophiala aquamarina CBS 119918]KEF50876.1 hypothetical protein A1O9_13072 [Exophiala aquamarina CBS 119918]
MSSPAPIATAKSTTRWTREEVFELLCTLNQHIAEVSPRTDRPKDDEMKVVISKATSLLSKSVKLQGSTSRLERKLASLWKDFGSADGDKRPYALYQYGAFLRTLPGLEDPDKGFPGMLNEIAEEVKRRQMTNVPISPKTLRRSQRSTVRDNSVDPILCRCGFTHHISCIHCDECFSWQHTICYYNTEVDEDLPEKHICDECTEVSVFKVSLNALDPENDLARAMNLLDLHIKANKSPTMQSPLHSDHENPALGPFAMPRDNEFFWGPADKEITAVLERSALDIQQVVYSLLSVGLCVPKVKKTLAQGSGLDLQGLLKADHGPLFRDRFNALISQPVRSGTKIARMLMGLLSAVLMNLIFKPRSTRPQSVTELLYEMLCRNVLQMNGVQILRDLRRKNLQSLVENPNGQFAAAIAEQADSLAEQLLELLYSMVTDAANAANGLGSQAEMLPWKEILAGTFATCLKLKARMGLSERLYELYSPSIDSTTVPTLMVDELGRTLDNVGQKVEICLMPAVVEYKPEDLGMKMENLLLLPNEEIFIASSSEDSKSKGIVVAPAIVALIPFANAE